MQRRCEASMDSLRDRVMAFVLAHPDVAPTELAKVALCVDMLPGETAEHYMEHVYQVYLLVNCDERVVH